MHHKLALTRGLFKELVRVEQPHVAVKARSRTIPTHRQARTYLAGRALLCALLQFTKETAENKHNESLPPFRELLRRLLRRSSVLSAPAVRLLLLKAFDFLPNANPLKKAQLLALERR